MYSQTKDIKSNIQQVSQTPIQVQHGYMNAPQPSVAVIESNSSNLRTLRNQPPLPPLVIPPTTHNSVLMTTPTRTSSMMKDTTPINFVHTPGGVSTPGSCRSTDSPYTPKQTTLSPSSKKQSFLPDNEAERLLHQGIKYHEAGKLEEATLLFKQASNLDLPIALFLYGISLRHGWVILAYTSREILN